MKVFIEDKPAQEIQLGDLFSDERSMYVLIAANTNKDEIMLISMRGKGRWNKYKGLEEARVDLTKQVNSGMLHHYSQDKFHLMIKES